MVQPILPEDFDWSPKAADVEFTIPGNPDKSSFIIMTLIGCGISNSEGQMCNAPDYDLGPIVESLNSLNMQIEVLIQSSAGLGMPPPPLQIVCLLSCSIFVCVFPLVTNVCWVVCFSFFTIF